MSAVVADILEVEEEPILMLDPVQVAVAVEALT
jgi:hypothetical protein